MIVDQGIAVKRGSDQGIVVSIVIITVMIIHGVGVVGVVLDPHGGTAITTVLITVVCVHPR